MKETKTLPILLKEPSILLIGGGKVALQKAQVLAENHIDFSIISQELDEAITSLCSSIQYKRFKLKDIGDTMIIIDATGNNKVTKKLLKYKKKHPILLNVVDNPHVCDFYFMALTPNAPLQIAVTSSGASPTLAKYFRDKCQNIIPQDFTLLIQTLQKERNKGMIDPSQTLKRVKGLETQVYLIGCGLGDPELLTLKAYRHIQEVDVVLYDHLISDEIMAIVPPSTLKIFVGKKKGFHSKPQEEINTLIQSYVMQGHRVARLKSGDPFVFGRGAEELLYLTQKGIKIQAIAGISSAISAPLMANIPITTRGYANGFTVVSAHLKQHKLNLDWIELLHTPSHTVVVLMGLSRIQSIVKEALVKGVSSQTPCAIISNASRPNQHIITTTLESLNQVSLQASRPAIIVFGDVINYTNLLEKSQK